MNSKGTKAMLGLCLLALPSLRLIGDVCAAPMRYLGEGPLALMLALRKTRRGRATYE